MSEALSTTEKELGGLNVIFNNAGIAGSDQGWDRTIAVNLTGVYHGLFYGAPYLAARGGGAIINTASVAGLVGLTGPASTEELQPGAGSYVAAKHGVAGLTKQYAVTFGAQGVRVNAVAPATTRTPRVMHMLEGNAGIASVTGRQMLGIVEPEEIALMALYLASDEARRTTGQIFPVDSGVTIS